MKRIEFLKTVWPPTGNYCIATPNINRAKKPGYRHHIEDTIGLASGYANSIFAEKDAYFGIFTHIHAEVYNESMGRSWPSRKRENMSHAKTLFLDLDVGKGPAKYPTQGDALAALARLVFRTGLPSPFTLSSGNGVHGYWPFTDPLDVAAWKPLATMLRQLLDHHSMTYDPSRTLDTTSVLRVPGTLNHKDPQNPKPVTILNIGDVTDTDALIAQLTFLTAGLQPLKVGPAPHPLSGIPTHNFIGNISPHGIGFPPTDVNDVATECGQVALFRDTTGNISEPHWYAALGVVGFCTDGVKWAHRWSSGHPNYSHAETQAKIDQWQLNGSVTSCAKLAQDGAQGVCQACPHFQSLHKNPVVITNKKPLVAAQQQAALMAPAPIIIIITPPTITCPLPICDPEWPYERLAAFGVQRIDGKLPTMVLANYDLYPVSVSSGRVENSESMGRGASTWVARWRGKTGATEWVQFVISTDVIYKPADLATLLANNLVFTTKAPEVSGYMSAYLQALNASIGSTKQYGYVGWLGKDTFDHFILNRKVIDASGVISPCLMSSDTDIATGGMSQGGTLQGQIDALKFYSDTNAYAAQQFFILCSLGTPLFIATGHNGLVISAFGESGASKTTALRAAGGIWGDPSKFVVNGTMNGMSPLALDKRSRAIPNLPTCIDEITNMDEEDARAIVMGASQAEWRVTLKSDRTVRELKTNAVKSALMLTSSNKSLHQLVNTNAQAGIAGSARVFELLFNPAKMIHTKSQADKAKYLLDANYGWVGERFMQEAMPTIDKLMKSVRRLVDRMTTGLSASSAERFYIAAAAPAFVAGAFASYHGLIDWDMEALYYWFISNQYQTTRDVLKAEERRMSHESTIRDFLSDHVLDTITSDGVVGNIPLIKIRNQIAIEKRTDKREIWVSSSVLRRYCDRQQVSYSTMLDYLHNLGVVKSKHVRRTLAEGSVQFSSRPHVVILNMDHKVIS